MLVEKQDDGSKKGVGPAIDSELASLMDRRLTLTPTPDTIVLTFFWASTNPDIKFAYASLCA